MDHSHQRFVFCVFNIWLWWWIGRLFSCFWPGTACLTLMSGLWVGIFQLRIFEGGLFFLLPTVDNSSNKQWYSQCSIYTVTVTLVFCMKARLGFYHCERWKCFAFECSFRYVRAHSAKLLIYISLEKKSCDLLGFFFCYTIPFYVGICWDLPPKRLS